MTGRAGAGALPWDEYARPRGPAQDVDATYTALQLATGQHLVAVHDHLRDELRRLRALVAEVAAGETAPSQARQELVAMTLRRGPGQMGAYCQAYCRLVSMHHRIEDHSVFPHLARSDPRLGPVIERLQHEHEAIHKLVEAVDEALRGHEQGAAPDVGLPAALESLAAALLSHLSYEEEELVEPLARLGFY